MKLHFLKNNKLNKGFTLLETLVAVGIFTISILALLSVLANGIASTNAAKRKLTASYLAQQGVEYVRNERDKFIILNSTNPQVGWDAFKTWASTNPPSPAYTHPITYAITDPVFAGLTRTAQAVVNPTYPNEVKISATVSWNQGFGAQSVTFSEYLFNWTE